MADPQELRQIMQTQFSNAKSVLEWSEGLAITVGVASVFLVLLPDDKQTFAWVGGLVSIALLVVERFLRDRFRTLYDDAEDIRRLFLLCDGLGQSPSEAELARIRTRIDVGEVIKSGPYFTSPLSASPKRLLMLVWESAFWSEDLQRLTAKRFFGWAIATTGAAFFAVMVALQGPEGPWALKVVAPALVVLVGANFWGKWRDAQRAERACKDVIADCQARVGRPWHPQSLEELREVMQIAMRYNAAMLCTYPASDRLYEKRGDALNKQWAKIAAEVHE